MSQIRRSRNDADDALLTIREIAELDRCSEKTVRRAIDAGLLQALRLGPGGRLLRVTRAAHETYRRGWRPVTFQRPSMSIHFSDLPACRENSADRNRRGFHATVFPNWTPCPLLSTRGHRWPKESFPMNQFTPFQLDTAFVQPGTPMVSDVMRAVEADTDLSPDRRRDILSGLRRMCKALDRAPEEVPADAHWLQPRLEKIAPASLGISAKSWSNLLSDARAGLVLHGVVERRISRKADLSPEWSRLWGIVLDSGDPTLPFSLSRMVHFLNRLGIEPDEVSSGHAEAYRVALGMNELSRPPEEAWRAAVNAWNLAVRRVPEWPRHEFSLPSRSKTFRLDIGAFPVAFGRDLERYLDSLLSPDPFNPEAVAVPLRPASVKQYRSQLLRFASVLVHAGVPACEIDGLAAIVTVERVEAGLRWMLKRTDERPTAGVSDMINVLKVVAKRHVRVDEATLKRLERMDARLAVKSDPGMTAKNRERLRPLEDPATLRRLLQLPPRLFDRSIGEREPLGAALAQEEAVAMAILVHCPIRCANLTGIHLERNICGGRATDGSSSCSARTR